MKYLEGPEAQEAEKYLKIATEQAKNSTCYKSQRGALIIKDNQILGLGYNKVTLEKLCHPCIRENIKDNSRVELCSALHAEQMALLEAINKGESLNGSRMYHIKVKKGQMQPSGDPSCTVCSRLISASGIKEVVLWHQEGYALYNVEEFNRLSFQYFLKR